MKISSELMTFVENVVKTSQSVDIENVIVDSDNGTVRGIDEARTVVLFQNQNVPTFPVSGIGLSRIGLFLRRYDIVKAGDDFQVDAEVVTQDDIKYVKKLHMKNADTKAEYRCANPDAIKAPKQINDTIIYHIQINADAVNVLQQGYGAYGTETVSVIADDNGVVFELEDISEDFMRHVFTKESIQLGESTESGSFTHKYPIKTLLALFKQNPDGEFEIGEKGILRMTVNALDFYVLPQV